MVPEFGSLQLPKTFADYISAGNNVAVSSAVLLNDTIEAVCLDAAGTSDEVKMDIKDASVSVSGPT